MNAIHFEFLVNLCLSLVCGVVIGAERELRNKPAGISTQTLVIGAATFFTFMSRLMTEGDPTRIAAQIVSGIGFLGAGIILKSGGHVSNVTTAASIWFSASIGMALGFNFHLMAIIGTIYAVVISRIPRIKR